MLYLGQTVNNGGLAAIYIGKNLTNELLVLVAPKDNVVTEIKLENGYKDIDFIKIPDSTSPTGEQIYHGSLHKKVMGDFKLKRPEESLILKELSMGQKLIKKHHK